MRVGFALARSPSVLIGAIALLLCSAWPDPARGDVLTWNGLTSDSWNLGANWTPAGPPTAGDAARILIDDDVLLHAPSVAASLQMDNGGRLDTNGQTLTVGGTATLHQATSATVSLTARSASGSAVTASDLSVQTGAQLVLAGGQVTATNNLTVDAASSVSGSGTMAVTNTYDNNGSLTVTGSVSVSAGTFDWDGSGESGQTTIQTLGALTVTADAIESSAGDGFDGILSVGANASLTVNLPAGQAWRMDGTMTLGGGFLTVSGSPLEVNGTAEGVGLIFPKMTNAGTVRPGVAGPGILQLNNSYVQTADGTLDISIAGPNVGSQYDLLTVSGTAELDGQLKLTLTDGYVPTVGTQLRILDSSGRTGIFATIDGVATMGNVSLAVTYGGTDGGDVLVTAALPGDTDLNKTVGLGDLATLAGNYGQPFPRNWTQGDFSGDGEVGLLDLSILAGNYGRTAEAVPEPSVITPLVLCALMWLGRGRGPHAD